MPVLERARPKVAQVAKTKPQPKVNSKPKPKSISPLAVTPKRRPAEKRKRLPRDLGDLVLVTRWLAGDYMKSIAHGAGKCRSQATERIHRIGVPRRAPGKRMALSMWPFIVAWAKAGFTAAEIADGIGLKGRARALMIDPDIFRITEPDPRGPVGDA